MKKKKIPRSNHGLSGSDSVEKVEKGMFTDYVWDVEVNGQGARSRLLRHWQRSEEICVADG